MSLKKVDFTQSGGGDSSKRNVNINWKTTKEMLSAAGDEPGSPSVSSLKDKTPIQDASSVVQQMRGTLEQLQVSLRSSREDETMLLKSHAYTRRRLMLLSMTLERATSCNHSLTETLLSTPERCPHLETTLNPGESMKREGDMRVQLVHRGVQTHDMALCDSQCPCTCHKICGPYDASFDCSRDVDLKISSQQRGAGDNDERVEQLSHALLQTKKALRARESAVVDICVKFLHMRRRRLRQAQREAELLRVVRCLRTVLASTTQTLLRETLDRESGAALSPPPTLSANSSSTDSSTLQERSDSPPRSTPPALSFDRRRGTSRQFRRALPVNASPSESSMSTSHVDSSSMAYSRPSTNSPHFKLPRLRIYSSPYSSSSSTSSVFSRRFIFPRFKKFTRPYVYSWRTRLSSLSTPYKRLFKSRSLYSWPSSSRTLTSSPRSSSVSSKQTTSLMSHIQSEHSDISLLSPEMDLLSDSSYHPQISRDYCVESSTNLISKSDPLLITEVSINKYHCNRLKSLRTPSVSLSHEYLPTPRLFINTENSSSKQHDI